MDLWFQYDDLGRVASYTSDKANTENLNQIMLSVDDDTFALMKQNYDLYIQNNNLLAVKPQRLIDSDAEAQLQEDKDALREKIQSGKATLNDISQMLLKLL